ncbi:MAG TPA: pyridoxal-dependent decarboxylase [Fimbriimonas sp.]
MDETSLDPKDWEAFRRLLHRAADDVVDFLSGVRETPAWSPMPPSVPAPVPRQGLPEEEVYREIVQRMLPYRLGNIHPRFWTRVAGTGTPVGVLADFMASAMNSNAAGQDSSATRTETEVVEWLKEILGFPASASGLMTLGASTANLIGLTVARNQALANANREGVGGSHLVAYCSDEAHISIERAMALLGLGVDNLRRIPTDDEYRMDPDRLEAAIALDRHEGRVPFAVVGTAGTVATGSTDGLDALADLCARERVWFHVDGAFGALACMSPQLKPMLKGMDRADSLGFDLHKWMHVPYDCGCAIVRDAEAHRRAFLTEASYLAVTHRGSAAGNARFYELGPDLSRSFRALKVWATLKTYGTEGCARSIEQNVEQARYLAARIEAEPRLTLMAPVPLNIVCFRFSREMTEAEHRRRNEEASVAIQEQGIAVASTVDLKGRNAMRVCLVNHRTRREDLDLFLGALLHAEP